MDEESCMVSFRSIDVGRRTCGNEFGCESLVHHKVFTERIPLIGLKNLHIDTSHINSFHSTPFIPRLRCHY